MKRLALALCLLWTLALVPTEAPWAQSPDPSSPRMQGVQLLEAFLMGDDDVSAFLRQHAARGLDDGARRNLQQQLTTLREAVADGEIDAVMPAGPLSVRLEFMLPDGSGIAAHIDLTDDTPPRLQQLSHEPLERPTSNNPVELSWETLEAWMEHEAKVHFTGSILVVRDDKPVLRRGYGWANADKKIRNTPETIFAIGSMPIDFTMASILQLAAGGVIDLQDPVTKYFDDIPPDKHAITLDMLMRGRSGLQDFHDLPGDDNPDHTWIDRDEAIRRIFNFPLHFEPGQGRAHSHSAFGVLAAVVEIASQQSFQDYCREHLYAPAGMVDTGFFGTPIPEKRLAVGHGMRTSGKINAPPYWGQTSWLVMGSGGQTSTVDDLGRWLTALHDDKIVPRKDLSRIVGTRGGAFGVGGNMFGFEIHYSMGEGTYFVVMSNASDSIDKRRLMEAMSQELRTLLPAVTNPYSVGIAIDMANDKAVLARVVPGSAAQRDGLQEGDTVLTIAGRAVPEHNPIDVLDELLAQGNPITFEIERQGRKRTVEVTPKRRDS